MEKQTPKIDVLSRWKNREKKEVRIPSISKAPEGAVIPLSHGQRRLWFLQQLYPESPFYNYSEKYVFTGELEVQILFDALRLVCNDHDVLRSTYHINGEQLYIKVAPEANIQITEHDLSNLTSDEAEVASKKIMSLEAQHLFDLAKHPVVLVSLIKLGNTKHLLLLTLHHISTDKWSMGLLRKDWAKYYERLRSASSVEEQVLAIQHSDYTYWLQSQEIDPKQLAYWKGKLSGEIPFINLPVDFSKPDEPSFKGAACPTHYFGSEESNKILTLAKELEVTPYVLFLSVYYLLLFRYSGQKDILVGSPIASRDQKAIENLIGFFNETVVLRTELSGSMSFKELVQEVKKNTLEAFSNKDIPFDTLVKELKQERSRSLNPFFQVMFLYHSVPETPTFSTGLELEHDVFDSGVSKFDLTLYISEEKGILSSTFEYATDLFSAATIERFQGHFKTLLEGILKDRNQHISSIPILTEKENEFFLKQNVKVANPLKSYQGIHEVISDVSKQHPESLAVTFQNDAITYQELDERSTLLAKLILSKTQKRNEIVGLCIDRSLDMIIGLVAILKAGCAYLPIDPKYPKKRINFVLNDAEVDLILTQSKLTSLFEGQEGQIIQIDDISISEDKQNVQLPVANENDLAYMIYTSGSTGNPKGVAIKHKNILNSTGGRLQFYNKNPKAFLLMSSISFDSSKAGIFWTLCTGGNLVITENRIEQDISRIAEVIDQHSITHALMLPSLYTLVLEHGDTKKMDSLNTVMVAGEACPSHLCKAHFSKFNDVELYNEYGPTEATVWCIAHKVEESHTGVVPLGKPVANSEIYLLDEFLNTVPFGAVGEIYVGGESLSGEYFKRPDLTAKAYVKNPFGNNLEEKLYKTGDLGRYGVDGTIEFLGRSDQQIKIRGYRVELEEIARAIKEDKTVTEAVVLAESLGQSSSKRLAAYITSDENLSITDTKARLMQRLPHYMVPTSISVVEKIPTLPNGKIDKNTLNNLPKQEREEIAEITGPSNELESKLLALWKEILQIDSISVHDNFFDLGGDSILSIQFIAKARKKGMILSPNQIFDYQTISKLATFLAAKKIQEEEWDYLVALRKEGSKKPLFCIHAGGGHIFFYNVLTKHIDTNRPIYALQASGVYANQNMHSTIEEMATDYLKAIKRVQPKGPYNIVIYCFSAAVGHQILHQLESQNEVGHLIIIDTMADQWNLNTPKRLKMRFRGFVKRFLKNPIRAASNMISDRWVFIKSRLKKIIAPPEEKSLIELNSNLASISKKYSWRKTSGKISIILTEKEEESINTEIVDSWKQYVSGNLNITRIQGVHRDLFVEPHIKVVSEKIDEFAI